MYWLCRFHIYISVRVYEFSADFVRFAMQAAQSAQGQRQGGSREEDRQRERGRGGERSAVGPQVRQRSVTFLRSRGHMLSRI